MDALDEQFEITATHPALPGHFPGNPIVPGVMLLDRVVALIERGWQARVAGFAQVKFLRPLAPAHPVRVSVERTAMVRFRILDGEGLLASGIAELAS